MSKKAAILGLTTVVLIAAAAVSYFGYTFAGPVDADSLMGLTAPRTGSHFKSPRVEVSVETGDRIDWDFRDVHSPYREKDSQGNWVDGTHILKEEYCAGDNHPDDYFIAGYKMADFGLTDVGDNGYLLQGRFTAPPPGNKDGWKHRPFHHSINPSGTEQVNKWHMRVRQRSRTDVDDSMPLAALKKDGNYAGPKEQCFYGQAYRFTVTHRVQITPTPIPPTAPPNTAVPAPTPTRAVDECSGRRYGHWHGEKGPVEQYDENFHRQGGQISYGDYHCMTMEEREEYNLNRKGTKWTTNEPSPHEH